MRKNVKNDKVLKAITIGLAAMIAATSMPMNVYAEGENNTEGTSNEGTSNEGSSNEGGSGSENGSSSSESNEQNSSESQGETMTISAMDSEVTSLAEATEDVGVSENTPAPEGNIPAALDQAIVEVSQLTECGVDANTVDGIVADITTAMQGAVTEEGAEGGIAQVNASLDEAQQILDKAVQNEAAASTSVQEATNTANEKITALETKITECENKEAELAKTAPNTKAELVSLDTLYTQVQDAYDEAEDAYTEAKNKYEAAVEDMEKLKEEINSAYTNATAAHERMKAAQKNVDALAENANKIKDIQEQYYEMLVHFYRVGLGKTFDTTGMSQEQIDELNNKKKAAFDSNGKLNIQVCEDIFKNYNIKYKVDVPVKDENGNEKKDENGKTITEKEERVQNLLEYMARNPGNDVFLLNRDLTNKIVSYMLEKEGNSDVKVGVKEIEKLGKGESQSNKKAVEGVLFTNSEWIDKKAGKRGKDQVVVTSTTTKDIDGNIVIRNEQYDFWVTSDGLSDGGRMNRIKVTYKDANGDDHSVYYNYVFKAAEGGDDLGDFAKGPIYLAQISKDADGSWVAERDNSDNNYFDYDKLTAKMRELAPYFEAQAAVNAAEQKVADLESRLERLSKANIGTEVLDALRNRLDTAKKFLDEMEQRKEEVEDQIANLPDESNDGSDDTTGGGDDTTGGDTTPSTGEPTFDPGTGTITIPGYDAPIILPSYSPSGVLGVRTDASTDGVGGLQLDGIGDTGNDEKNELKINPIVKKNTVNKNRLGKKISDPAVPLAAIPDVEDDSVTMNWMWLLIIFLLGATGKKMYDEYRKKVEAEEAAKNKDK